MIDRPPPPALALALGSLRSEGVPAAVRRVEHLSNTPLIYNLCSPSVQEKKMEGRRREGLRDAVPFAEKMANTCACPSTDSGWQIFQGTNSNYHSTAAKAPALSQCGGSVMCVGPADRPGL